jgi:UDP-glucose 4-epimerase
MEWGLSGKPLMIYGDGSQTRDFVYVEDVAEAMLKAGISNISGTFNIATGSETSVLELASLIQELRGSELKMVHLPERKGEIKRSLADISRLQNEIGPMDPVKLKEGLRKTFRWFETQPDRVVH